MYSLCSTLPLPTRGTILQSYINFRLTFPTQSNATVVCVEDDLFQSCRPGDFDVLQLQSVAVLRPVCVPYFPYQLEGQCYKVIYVFRRHFPTQSYGIRCLRC